MTTTRPPSRAVLRACRYLDAAATEVDRALGCAGPEDVCHAIDLVSLHQTIVDLRNRLATGAPKVQE